MSYSLDILNRFKQIETDKDIKALSYAIYPGTHCPLFGAGEKVKKAVKINTTIPSQCTLEELKKATSVKLNMVTDHIALELAEAMKEKFAIPYIYFGKAMDLEIIRKLYEVIEETLNIKVLEALASKEEKYNQLLTACKQKLSTNFIFY